MLTNMVLLLAKQPAQNKSVKMATAMHLDAVVTALARAVIAGGTAALRRPFASRKNRRLAEDLARTDPRHL